LEQKHVEPPYVPKRSKAYSDVPKYATFEQMLKELGKDKWVSEAPKKVCVCVFAVFFLCAVCVCVDERESVCL